MCGICGIIGSSEEELVSRMLRRLVHRGPDEQGLHRESGVPAARRDAVEPSRPELMGAVLANAEASR